ncbi:MAG: PepSY domain-containing protein, partial [Planctomycetota bacterium]
MKPYRLNRRLHAQIGFWIAAPLLLVTVTGILLLVKKQWGFVQPPEQRGTVAANPAGLDVLLASLTAEPELGVVGW